MNGLCKDCSHWQESFTSPPDGMKDCQLLGAPQKNKLAFAESHYVTNASLHTAPDFGCVLFEPREGAL